MVLATNKKYFNVKIFEWDFNYYFKSQKRGIIT